MQAFSLQELLRILPLLEHIRGGVVIRSEKSVLINIMYEFKDLNS